MKNKPEKMAVFAILQKENRDMSLPELMTLLPANFTERTVRRWLSEMIIEKSVEKTGQKRGTRYRVFPVIELNSEFNLNISKESRKLIDAIRRPIFERSPVAYNPKWLAVYEPNKTFYLAKNIKQQLHEMGEKSKTHLPAGTYARHIYNRLLIDLSYNSSRLEGNTYSLLDTQRLILEGSGAQGKLDEEKIMILNHKEAIAYLVNNAQQLQINTNTICTLHYLLADGLVPTQYAGKVRDYGVRISSSVYIPWENPEKLKNQLQLVCQKAALIQDPYEQSLFLLAHIAYLQAFSDVNKRTSRLSANIPLIQHNLVPLSFNDVSSNDYTSAMISIYELNDIRVLIELYAYSYYRTCQLYEVTLDVVSYDEVRVRYRQQRREFIRHIILTGLTSQAMNFYIQQETKKQIKKSDQLEFMADIKEDLNEITPERIVGLGITVQQLNLWLKKYRDSY